MKKLRLDLLLVRNGLVPSRQQAQAMILQGNVLVNDRPVDKAGAQIAPDATIRLRGKLLPYVSRGGLKLEHALDFFHLSPKEAVALDVGISTGGFTDCLLQRGAHLVYGIDVGRGQVAWKLRQDPRVVLFESTNVRHFDTTSLDAPVDLAVIDVSFISLTLVLPVVAECLKPGGHALPMVKPQFEVGKGEVGKKGVVRDPEKRKAAVEKIKTFAANSGFEVLDETESPVPGPKGNIEFFLLLRKNC